ILMAMGENRIVPFSKQMAETSDGEPRNAMMVTGVLTVLCIMVRDLNAIAPLVTMFFLITYCMINVVVLFEDGLGLVSYRPTLRVPRYVPFIGLVGCVFSMFIVNPTFGLISVAVVLGVYLVLHVQDLDDRFESDARSTVFVAFAQWAASKVASSDLRNVRAWKPNLLVPVEDVDSFRGSFPVVVDLAKPEGSVLLLGVAPPEDAPKLKDRLAAAADSVRARGVRASWSILAVPGYARAIGVGLMALQGAFFRPNVLFLRIGDDAHGEEEIQELARSARESGVGVVLYRPHARAGLGQRKRVRMYVRPPVGTTDVHAAFDRGNLNLILLMGYRVWRHWEGELSVVTVIDQSESVEDAERFLAELCDIARLPPSVQRRVEVGTMEEASSRLGVCDLAIFGLTEGGPELEWTRRMTEVASGACLFVRDSGGESARA
ncbi:MAG: Na-K-Cl cotransporter, partial [Proteobacteria bacterium]|nr:Na-K-Cl cotransporter [Pseudomonadota bacterium]